METLWGANISFEREFMLLIWKTHILCEYYSNVTATKTRSEMLHIMWKV